jgi:hypothetical protein
MHTPPTSEPPRTGIDDAKPAAAAGRRRRRQRRRHITRPRDSLDDIAHPTRPSRPALRAARTIATSTNPFDLTRT